MNLTAKLVYPQIVHMEFDSQYFLASSFMRIQEFYESPFENIRGNSFTVFDYMDTYAREYGKFNYFEYWSGFNFPDIALKKFLRTQKIYYSQEAIKFVYIKCLVNWKKPFYVIGTYKRKDLNHELSHAFYYLSKRYKSKMDSLMVQISSKNRDKLLEDLKDIGYAWTVRNDEIQAYLSTENKYDFIPSDLLKEFKETFEFEKLNFGLGE